MLRRACAGIVCASIGAVACHRPAEAPEPSGKATADPVEIAVAPPSATQTEPADRPSAFGSAAVAPEAPRRARPALGVPACDEYLQLWDDCFQDPAMRDAVQPAIEAMMKAWGDVLESGPEGRGALEAACEAAREAFPADACQASATP